MDVVRLETLEPDQLFRPCTSGRPFGATYRVIGPAGDLSRFVAVEKITGGGDNPESLSPSFPCTVILNPVENHAGANRDIDEGV